MSEKQEERVFRVWVFDRQEDSNEYVYDNWGDRDYEIKYDIQGAESSDLTQQELLDLRAGFACSDRKAMLVRDLRKQEAGTYAKTISDMISAGRDIREKQKLDEERRIKLAALRKKKTQVTQVEKKRKQLEKLHDELKLLDPDYRA